MICRAFLTSLARSCIAPFPKLVVLLCRISGSDIDGIICLPLNTYSIVQSDHHGGLLVEAGVLQNNKCLQVAQQKFVNGHCSVMAIGSESSA